MSEQTEAPEAIDWFEEEEEDYLPTPLSTRALDAQDRMGWAPMPTRDGDTEFASGAVDLARVVTEMARTIEHLQAQIAKLTDDVTALDKRTSWTSAAER